jgi:allantoin racemase
MAKELRRLVAFYGYGDRVATVAALDPSMDEFELDRAFAGSPEFVARFTEQARKLVSLGADVIIPAEGVLNTVLVRNNVRRIDGIPVLDSYGSLLGLAETLVRLRRRSGLSTSRGGAYASTPAGLTDNLRRFAIEALRRA